MGGEGGGGRCTFRDAGYAREQEDCGLEGAEERPGPGEEEVSDAAVGEVEAEGGVGEDLGMEVDQEGADGVLVGLRDLRQSKGALKGKGVICCSGGWMAWRRAGTGC